MYLKVSKRSVVVHGDGVSFCIKLATSWFMPLRTLIRLRGSVEVARWASFGVRDAGWVQLEHDCCRCLEVSSRWNWYTYHYYGCGNIGDELYGLWGGWKKMHMWVMKVHICRGSMYQVWTKLKWHANFISLVTLISLSKTAGKLNLMGEAWPRHVPLSFQSELLPIVADWSDIDRFHCTESHLGLQLLRWRRRAILNFFWRARGSRCGGFGEERGVRIANLSRALCWVK